jgi:hypothetical protein
MRVLVLTTEPLSAAQLRDALPDGADPEDVEAMVIAPAIQESPLQFWFSDADDAIAKADEVRRRTVQDGAGAGRFRRHGQRRHG